MSDIINLLPDHLANQIAAGEVIQRPASAVKELLENAIDAGATDIQLILKDAGKELIQVIDNGKGMSPMDARMSFERHATSKIKSIEDLFRIKTMGFRGEALASVAAVAQVELKTCPSEAELGTYIRIEGSRIISQESVSGPQGTSLAIKNLFYNVPARRKFLKSNASEMRHILDEFTRVAMAYPQIGFSMFHNGTEQFRMEPGNLKTRIVSLLGSNASKNLIPVAEKTDLISFDGFVGKPEAATKTRGNQFFFVNGRFIKSPYLNHAVAAAYENMIPRDSYPFYVLFLELDPEKVDVNVHPTKQEVKFDDEKIIYAYLHAAVKHALARYNIAPSIDFTLNAEIFNNEAIRMPQSVVDKNRAATGYLSHNFSQPGQAGFIAPGHDLENWNKQKKLLFDDTGGNNSNDSAGSFFPAMPVMPDDPLPVHTPEAALFEEENNRNQPIIQWRQFLITTMKSGLLLLHPQRALERIIFEKLDAGNHSITSQQLLFPVSIEINAADIPLLEAYLPEFAQIGYQINKSGVQYVLSGVPSDLPSGNEQHLVEEALEQLKSNSGNIQDRKRENIRMALARHIAAREVNRKIDAESLIAELFACNQPQYTPSGNKIFSILSVAVLDGML